MEKEEKGDSAKWKDSSLAALCMTLSNSSFFFPVLYCFSPYIQILSSYFFFISSLLDTPHLTLHTCLASSHLLSSISFMEIFYRICGLNATNKCRIEARGSRFEVGLGRRKERG
ncbi:hypothetical protein KAI78_05095 [bacterium]|nr:hypothetical protein [bacterium]